MTEELKHVALLLREPLADEPEQLIKDLEAIEVWNARMQFILAESKSRLAKEAMTALPDSGTELQRKTTQKATLSNTQGEVDKIEGLCEAIKTRITLGQSILKYYSSTQNIQYKENKSLREILGEK